METEINFEIEDDIFEKVSQDAQTLEKSVEQIIRDYLYQLAGLADGKVK
jgi:hypothetical protein